MTYTSPSPANIALNGNLTTWWIPATNLSTVTATGVTVNVVVDPAGGLKLETWSTDTGSFNSTTKIWSVGTLAPGQTKWLKLVTKVIDVGLAPFTMTSVISGNGIDPNNTNNTLEQTITSVVTSVTAGAVADEGCSCVDVSLNDTICNYGVTEWRLTSPTVTNSTVYDWDVTTGKGKFIHDNPFLDITTSYSIWCDPGTGFVQISGPVTLTISKLFDDISIWNHIPSAVQYADLSVDDIAVLTSQYPSLDLEDYCWNILRNAEGDLTGGTPINCNESKARAFYACIEDECIVGDEACPCSNNIPAAVEATLPEGYTPNEGDIIFVQHPYARSVWRYSEGSGWVRDSCGCVAEAVPLVSAAFTGTNTKTLTLTFEDASTVTASFTDLQNNFVLNHDECGISSGAGTVEDPLVIDTPLPIYSFAGTTYSPGDLEVTVNVSTLFPETCAEGCAPTYSLGGYSELAYENVTLVGITLTFDVLATAPAGNNPIIINRICQ